MIILLSEVDEKVCSLSVNFSDNIVIGNEKNILVYMCRGRILARNYEGCSKNNVSYFCYVITHFQRRMLVGWQ